MRTIATLAATATAATALIAGAATTADAATATCRGTRTGGTVSNLVVPKGATCTLNRVKVTGSVTVGTAGTLNLRRSAVAGNVTANYANTVDIANSTVRGTIRSAGMKSGSGADQVPNNRPMYLHITGGSSVGRIIASGTRLGIDRSTVRSSLATTWGDATVLNRATVLGAVSVTNNYGGHVTVCGSSFSRPVNISTGRFGAFIGDGCTGNTFRSTLVVDRMTGVRLSNNVIRGAASGVNEAFMAPSGIVGAGNSFQGTRSGDFADSTLG